jgi:hypothetical protein
MRDASVGELADSDAVEPPLRIERQGPSRFPKRDHRVRCFNACWVDSRQHKSWILRSLVAAALICQSSRDA